MRIAISAETENGLESIVAHHFGSCPYFALVDLDETEVKNMQVVANPFYSTHQPGQVPEFIHQQGADVMISGGMGRRALQFFQEYKIETATGATGSVQSAVTAYLNGQLSDAAPCKESVEHGH
jgi:predicted Fe-Mo cluster-binding NifX family protein